MASGSGDQPGCVAYTNGTRKSTTRPDDQEALRLSGGVCSSDEHRREHEEKRGARGVFAGAGCRGGCGEDHDDGYDRVRHAVPEANAASGGPRRGNAASSGRVGTAQHTRLRSHKSLSKTRRTTACAEPSFKCIICKRGFLSTSLRQQHYNFVHSKRRPY